MPAPAAKPRVFLRTAIVVVLLGVVAAVTYYRFRATALVVTVHRDTAVDAVAGSVVVHADKDLQEIKSELGGRVAWIDPRQLGESFKAGEPIVKLDSADLEREISQAQQDHETSIKRLKIQKENDATRELAKERFANEERRFKRGEISVEDLNAAKRLLAKVDTDLKLAEFDVEQGEIAFKNQQADRQRRLDKMTIRAPMDGILQAVMVAPGALIGSGTTVATFFSNQRVVIAKVREEDVGRVRVGQPAKIRLLNLGDETLDAKVTTILPFADADTQRYSIYVEVKADVAKLKPFSTGEATITVGEHPNQPLVPRRSLFEDNHVFVVHNGTVEKRQVKVGYKALNFAEVTENLKEGEQVIVDDIDQFRDGQHVRVVNVD